MTTKADGTKPKTKSPKSKAIALRSTRVTALTKRSAGRAPQAPRLARPLRRPVVPLFREPMAFEKDLSPNWTLVGEREDGKVRASIVHRDPVSLAS